MGSALRKSTQVVAVASVFALSRCPPAAPAVGHTTLTAAELVNADQTAALERLDQSAQLLTQFRTRVATPVATRTRCVLAFPSAMKGGAVVGAAFDGYATCRTSSGWSAPAPVTIGGGAFGTEIGTESADLLLLTTTDKGTQALLGGSMRIGVDVTAAPGFPPTGNVSSDAPPPADIVAYSRLRGSFPEPDLTGSTVKSDPRPTEALYGTVLTLSTILSAQVDPPESPAVHRFLVTVGVDFPATQVEGG
jgi:lipid-binding SYLF domain-containing protein